MRPKTQDDDDPFDERGILRDGRSVRVPLMLRDAAPSWQTDAAKYFDRKGVRVTAADGSTQNLHRAGYRIAPTAPVNDALVDAYEAYDQGLTSAWKTDAPPAGSYPYSASAEGRRCSIDGADGVLTRVGNVLVCHPVKQAAPGPQDHAITMDAAYQSYDRDLREAWRHR